MLKTAVRDSIHNWIKYSKCEQRVIDTALVQRLRNVGQLTFVSLVYPGGVHTRFSHSLGTMKLAGKYAKHLFRSHPNFAHLVQVARLAGLLHDVAHGPFSHAFDNSVYATIYPSTPDNKNPKIDGHDLHRIHLIQKDQELSNAIKGCGVDPSELARVWKTKLPAHSSSDESSSLDEYKVIGCFLHGPLGADRMDFTLRDSYETGMTHLGTIAHQRIISNSMIINGRLCYNLKCLVDVIQSLEQRLKMYQCVYLHRVSTAGLSRHVIRE